MRSRRTVILLAAVFVVLVVIAVLQNRTVSPFQQMLDSVPQTPGQTTLPTPVFHMIYTDMPVRSLQAIRLHDPITDAAFTLVRNSSGNWTAPGTEGALDKTTASDIAKTVVLLPYLRSLPLESHAKLTDYGFTPMPKMLIELVLINGEQRVIAIGGLVSTNTEYYAVADNRNEVFLLQRGAVEYLYKFIKAPPITPAAPPEATAEATTSSP